MSQGFATGIIAASISMTCLVLALMNELDNSKPGNPLGVPWAVRIEVRVAQYLGRFHILWWQSLSATNLLAMKVKSHSSIRTYRCVSNSDWWGFPRYCAVMYLSKWCSLLHFVPWLWHSLYAGVLMEHGEFRFLLQQVMHSWFHSSVFIGRVISLILFR